MHVAELTAYHIRVPLRRPVRHASHRRDSTENVVVRCRHYASDNSYGITLGGGADFALTKHVAFRAVQFEYFRTHFGGVGQNNLRLQTALVYRWGGASR